MAKLAQQPIVTVAAALTVNEAEMRALEALFCYGVDSLLEVFYEHLGKAYMTPHESGLRSLAEGVRRDVPPILRRTDNARAEFNKAGE
jgi:hypothetical protein